jgi:CheY-like chemotaxis protein
MMGGDLQVQSEPGRGSVFTVAMPPAFVESHPPQAAPSPRVDPQKQRMGDAPRGPDRRARVSTVLVIDDDPIARELIERLLNKEGFHVQPAASGQDGLRLAKELRPNVITLDVMMPTMDGWEVLRALKCEPDLASIPVVMLSMLDERGTGIALGAADYLLKPVDQGRLTEAVKRCVRRGEQGYVLIVDHDPMSAQSAGSALEAEGWPVVNVANATLALEAIRRSRPAAVLVDVFSPQTRGMELLTELGRSAEYQSIPVIGLTADALTKQEREFLIQTTRQVCAKNGCTREELLHTVGSLVARCTAANDR